MKRTRSQDDALDLFLDTICNTFGGVLFISILVVVLLNLTTEKVSSEVPTQVAQVRLVQLQQELAEARAELDRLESAVRLQKELADQISDPATEQLVAQLVRNQEALVRTQDQRTKVVADNANQQTEINDTAEAMKKQSELLEEKKKQAKALKEALQREIEKRSRTQDLPRMRNTNKQGAGFILTGGRLIRATPEECTFTKKDGAEFVVPKPGAGWIVPLNDRAPGEVIRYLKDLSKDQHYIKVFVYPDSFAQCAMMREALVSEQYEYTFVPLPAGEKILVGAGGQDQVQ